MANRPGFHPWRTVFLIAVLFTLPFMLMYDTGQGSPDALIAEYGEEINLWAGEAMGSFTERVLSSVFKLGLSIAVGAVLCFGFLQAALIGSDRRILQKEIKEIGWLSRLFRWLCGRSGLRSMKGHVIASAEWGADESVQPLRLGLTAFPMIGFIGTVIGLSGAIEGLPSAIGEPDKLNPVLSDLHTAFDTTLLGLIGALVCLALLRLCDAQIDALIRET